MLKYSNCTKKKEAGSTYYEGDRKSEVVDIDDNAGGYKSTLLICIAPYNVSTSGVVIQQNCAEQGVWIKGRCLINDFC